jgi:hypothetical protein
MPRPKAMRPTAAGESRVVADRADALIQPVRIAADQHRRGLGIAAGHLVRDPAISERSNGKNARIGDRLQAARWFANGGEGG